MSLSKTREPKLLYKSTSVSSSFASEGVRKVNMGKYQVQVDLTNVVGILGTIKLQMRVSTSGQWVDIAASQLTLDSDEDHNIVWDVELGAGFFRLSCNISSGSFDIESYYNITERGF